MCRWVLRRRRRLGSWCGTREDLEDAEELEGLRHERREFSPEPHYIPTLDAPAQRGRVKDALTPSKRAVNALLRQAVFNAFG